MIAEEQFHHGSDACIVCTSTLELGIDVGDLDRVLQSEAPDTVSSFLQRMGRTGRREGQVANTTFFCETTDGVLQAIALIELAKSGWVEHVVGERSMLAGPHPPVARDVARRRRRRPATGMGSPVARPRLPGHSPRRVRPPGRLDDPRRVACCSRRSACIGAEGGASLRPAELHGALRGLLEPAELHRADRHRATARLAQSGVRRPPRRGRDLLPPRRPCLGRARGSSRRPPGGGRPRPAWQAAHVGRIHPPVPRRGHLPEDPGRARVRGHLRLPDPRGRRSPRRATRRLGPGRCPRVVPASRSTDNEIRWWTFAGGRINTTLRYGLGTLLDWRADRPRQLPAETPRR